jgi:hypothetical protein
MKLSTAHSIPVDIYVTILDYLPLKDLASFYTAYAAEPKMSHIAKWRCMIRLCNIFTKGQIQAIPIIDGERRYYKQFRDEPFRQIALHGQSRATKPFRPFTAETCFNRIFRGNYLSPEMGLEAAENQFVIREYQPIDNTGAPAEVVRVDITFSYGMEVIQLEYDTNEVVLSGPYTWEYDTEDETVTHKTIQHRIPLVKVVCRQVDDDKEKGGYAIPKDWMEFMGEEVNVKICFVERLNPTRVSRLFWHGDAIMGNFEMSWKLHLFERCCTPQVIGIWKGRGDVFLTVPAQPVIMESEESEESPTPEF